MSVSSTPYDIARNFTIYLARTFGSTYFGSIYCFDLYTSISTSLIRRVNLMYLFILLRFRYYIETSMNYLTLTIYFRAGEERAPL